MRPTAPDPHARPWAAREKLLRLPRCLTPSEKNELERLEKHLIAKGVLGTAQDF